MITIVDHGAGNVKSFILMPAKWYTDFKNQEKILGKIYDVYRFIKNDEKTSNF